MPRTLAVIIARAASKGLPDKCVRRLAGRAVIEYTFEHARAASRLDAICLSTDSPRAADLARAYDLFVVDRPPELATDTATVDSAVRHAVTAYDHAHPGFHADIVVLLYGNVPLRPPDAIDRAVEFLLTSGADSVRTVARLSKQHPDWTHRLDGDRMHKFRENSIYRRQDLEPLYYHDGAVAVITRAALFGATDSPDDPHAFFGRDRRALVVDPADTVDIDDAADLDLAEARLSRRETPAIPLGSSRIGPARPTFIIAEAGVNHDGRLDRAFDLIDAAVAAGANAVKFQAFAADRLVSRDAPAAAYQSQHDPGAFSQHAMLRRLELSRDQFLLLRLRANQRGLLFIVTPFGLEDLSMLLDIGVDAVKIASPDIVNVPLLDAVAASRLPLIVSTGAAESPEIDAAVARLRCNNAADRLVLLHCISSYPTPQSQARLGCIDTLRKRFAVPVGFSDHTLEIDTGALARAAGAVVLEKHLTLNRALPGPDHFFSLEPDAFRKYVAAIRAAESALGDGDIFLSAEQHAIRRIARGRLIAARPLRSGERITPDCLLIRRAPAGLDASHYAELLGCVAVSDIPRETPLDWPMVHRRPVSGPAFAGSAADR